MAACKVDKRSCVYLSRKARLARSDCEEMLWLGSVRKEKLLRVDSWREENPVCDIIISFRESNVRFKCDIFTFRVKGVM